MRKMFLLAGLGMAVGLLLAGCMQQVLEPQEEGGISITIPPRSSNHMMSVGPKMIPVSAEFIRVRIYSWPFGEDFNTVVTIPLLPEGSTTDISIPVGQNYRVAAISYLESDGENYALTFAEQEGVDIVANSVTPVTLTLEPFGYSISGTPLVSTDVVTDITVVSGEQYSAYVRLGGELGRLESGGRMYASLTSFQNPSTPFPDDSFGWDSGQGYSYWEFRDNDAPSIDYTDEETTLYMAFLIKTNPGEWSDFDDPSRITLCIPNRYLGESLYEITVTPPPPPEGSLDLVIQ